MNLKIMGKLVGKTHLNFHVLNKNVEIGHAQYILKSNSAILTNMEIKKSERRKGYGSTLLKHAEKRIFKHIPLETIYVTAWQPFGSWDVIDFYKKNDFVIDKTQFIICQNQTYDDTSVIYDLYPMKKDIKPSQRLDIMLV